MDIEKYVEQRANQIIEQENKPSLDSLNNKYLNKQVEEGKTVSEIASDFAKAKVTGDIIKNENGKFDKLHKDLAEEQKETLIESFRQDKAEQQAKTLTAKQQKAEAFYTSFRPILEFDFSPLIHNNKKEEREVKTYKDRSYGIPLMVLMLGLFVIPYCVFSIILAIFNGLNAIFEAIATFGKAARIIAGSIFIILIMIIAIYCVLLGIDKLFGTSIIARLGF